MCVLQYWDGVLWNNASTGLVLAGYGLPEDLLDGKLILYGPQGYQSTSGRVIGGNL